VALAQPYDGVGDCERYATGYYKSHDSAFRSFVIDRKTVEEVAYDDSVGSQHVEAIFRGRATYMDAGRKITGTFVCLHAGSGKNALFIYLIPR
jgi:hypothetical protein